MLGRRVIPCLDVANGRVVKGTRFVDLVDAGDPPELAERYWHEGADELVFLDITAAPEGRAHAPRHRRADGPPGVHPAHGRRRRADRRRDARRAPGRRRQGLAEHRRRRRPGAHRRVRRRVRLARRSSSRSTPGAAARPSGDGWEVVVQGGRDADRASTPSTGRSRPPTGAPASSSSPRSIATGPGAASTPSCCGRSSIASRCRSSRRAARPDRRTSWRPSATAAPTRSWRPGSSTAGAHDRRRSRPRWPPPACRSGRSPRARRA